MSLADEAPTGYAIGLDVEETASAIITATFESRTAEGEVPQLQAVSESQGGGDSARTVVSPGIEVTSRVAVSGANVEVGIVGSSNI